MEAFKWYKTSELLPEDLDLGRYAEDYVDGQFLVCLDCGDVYAARRVFAPQEAIIGKYSDTWTWDYDSDDLNRFVKDKDIHFWMLVETPSELSQNNG